MAEQDPFTIPGPTSFNEAPVPPAEIRYTAIAENVQKPVI
jgi:hypothetical protein